MDFTDVITLIAAVAAASFIVSVVIAAALCRAAARGDRELERDHHE